MTKIALAAVAYALIVFPLAVGWHVGLFREKYEGFGYFAGEPKFLVGLASIAVQAVVLALVYPFFKPEAAGYLRAFQYVGLMGIFFWTSHVLSMVARNATPDPYGFLVMETGYVILQFALFGLALGWIYAGAE